MKNYILSALALVVTTASVSVTLDQQFNRPVPEYIVREVPVACEEPVAIAPVPALPAPVAKIEDSTPNDFISALRGEPGGNLRLLPHLAWNGEPDGIRVSGVRRDDPLSAHLDNGDVVREVNGLGVRDIGDLRLAIDKIKLDDGRVTLKLLRSGTPVTVHYNA